MKGLCTALAITALSLGQPARPIDGSWTAKFEGRTFITLEMKTLDGAISGGISLGHLEVDRQGLVKRADAAPAKVTPIFNVTRKGSIVTFFIKDGSDTDQFEVRVLENGDADLHILLNDEERIDLADSGVPLPKPIRLTKSG